MRGFLLLREGLLFIHWQSWISSSSIFSSFLTIWTTGCLQHCFHSRKFIFFLLKSCKGLTLQNFSLSKSGFEDSSKIKDFCLKVSLFLDILIDYNFSINTDLNLAKSVLRIKSEVRGTAVYIPKKIPPIRSYWRPVFYLFFSFRN